MIRYSFLYQHVLRLYRGMTGLSFPIDPLACLDQVPRCRAMSFGDFARLNGCGLRDVMDLCESESGCTHYDVQHGRYLILYNNSVRAQQAAGRIRWTKAHELGHVVLGHLPYVAAPQLAENSFNNLSHPDMEREADIFAGSLLAPYPLFELLGVRSAARVHLLFGLSREAADYRYRGYLRWKSGHRKTAWENDIRAIARERLDL